MNEKVLKWLFDIKIAIEEINSYFVKYNRTFKEYQNNLILKRAIERNLEIIGEAVNKIIKVEPDIEISNAKRIVGLRNQIMPGELYQQLKKREKYYDDGRNQSKA